ncbi:MAG TPA: ABC transporter permease [Terriglobales bacterium]|nr:ABC transporter permease [Terriglobales bacterium]
METLLQDIRFGYRMLRKAPAFTGVAIVVLALGIGANTAIFSVVNAVLLRPLPFQDPDRLVQVWHVPPPKSFPGMTKFSVSPANYLDWASQNHSFERMAIYGFTNLNLTGKGEPESVFAIRVSPDFFSVLRARPVLGRTFTPEENESGHGQVVVLGHAFWQTHFASDPNIVGQTISLNSQSYTVVGVMPAKFSFPISPDPKSQPQLWTPMAWTNEQRVVRGNHNYLVIARLQPGVDVKQAQAEMNTISSRLEQQYPADDKGWGANVVPLREELVGDVRPALLILLGAVAFVLLIACANVANLVLVKTLARQKEIAIRTALGASAVRVLRQILSETLMLSFTGGMLSLFVAHFGVRLIVAFLAQSLPRATDIGLDGWVLAFTLLISLLTGVIAGLVPAFRATKTNLNESLKQGLGRTDADSGGNRTRSILVVSEIALSLVLLIGAGLMIRSLSRLRNVDPGMDTHNVLTMSIDLSRVKYAQPVQQANFFDQLLQHVRRLPGVESASAIDFLPLGNGGSTQPIAVEGRPMVPMAEQPEVAVRSIEPEFIRTMRIPLLQGRAFNNADVVDRPGVILISQSMAKRIWPGENPIGKRLTLTFAPEKSREVVGVVGDVKQDGLDVTEPIATLYVPIAQSPLSHMSLVMRTSSQPATLVSAIANAVHEVDREQPVLDVITMDDILADSLSPQRFNMLLLATFSGLALLLAAIGIYSVLAYSVRRRVREIGVRMAMGAQRGDILRMILGQGTRLALIGAAIGTIAAFGLTRLMTSQLFGVAPTDPITFLSVTTLIVLVALVACYIPARRATKVDPMVALRYE